MIASSAAALREAPFGKVGQVAFEGLYLADEGQSNYTRWFGATGAARAATPPLLPERCGDPGGNPQPGGDLRRTDA